MKAVFGTNRDDILLISAKTGRGASEILSAIVDRIPPPAGNLSDPLKAYLFDSSYVSDIFYNRLFPNWFLGMIGIGALFRW